MIICEKEKCTGCMCCVNICGRECISMTKDKYGVLYPEVDEDKCVNCLRCVKSCPANKDISDFSKEPDAAYAASVKEPMRRKTSSSGGLADALYKYVNNSGGVCFGTKFVRGLDLVISASENEDDLIEFKGSKYTQASVEKTYKEVLNYIKEGRKVIYIGTPCQIAGLKMFLGSISCENLLTVDLICHGVPPQTYLKEHINSTAQKNSFDINNVDNITFRGEKDWFLTLYDKDKNILFSKYRFEDTYFLGFLNALFYREACYSCKYACSTRVSDITIGDFWGLGESSLFERPDRGNGVSAVLINTPKGQKFFDSIKEDIKYEKRSVSEAVQGNAQLRSPSPKNIRRDKFLMLYQDNGFEYAAQHCLKGEIRKNIFDRYKKKAINKSVRCKNKIAGKIRSILKG